MRLRREKDTLRQHSWLVIVCASPQPSAGSSAEILLGRDQGPRMGSFIALYGVAETITLIERALAGEDLSAA